MAGYLTGDADGLQSVSIINMAVCSYTDAFYVLIRAWPPQAHSASSPWKSWRPYKQWKFKTTRHPMQAHSGSSISFVFQLYGPAFSLT
jgi:hypothetical protein